MKIILKAKSGEGELTIEDKEIRKGPQDKLDFPETVVSVGISSTVGASHIILVDLDEFVRASKSLQPTYSETLM